MNTKHVAGIALAAVLSASVLGVASGDPPPVRGGSGANTPPIPPHPMPTAGGNVPSVDLVTLRSVSLSCANDEMAQTKICDTNNTCHTSRTPCFPYKCDAAAKTCAMTCSVDAHCASGASCQGGRCQLARAHCKATGPDQVSVSPEGIETKCGMYRCNATTGDCLRTCGTSADCVPYAGKSTYCDDQRKCATGG